MLSALVVMHHVKNASALANMNVLLVLLASLFSLHQLVLASIHVLMTRILTVLPIDANLVMKVVRNVLDRTVTNVSVVLSEVKECLTSQQELVSYAPTSESVQSLMF